MIVFQVVVVVVVGAARRSIGDHSTFQVVFSTLRAVLEEICAILKSIFEVIFYQVLSGTVPRSSLKR